MEKIHTPYCGIAQQHAFYRNILAIVKFKISVCIVLIAMYRHPCLAAAVKNAVSEYFYILLVFGVYPAVYQRVLIHIYAFVAFKLYALREVYSRTEPICHILFLRRCYRFAVKNIQASAVAVALKHILPVFRNFKGNSSVFVFALHTL